MYLILDNVKNDIAEITLIYYVKPLIKFDYVVVEELPQAIEKEGKRAVLCYNKKTKDLFYRYIDIPKEKENELQDRVDALEKSNGEMMALITTLSVPKM